MASIRKRGDKYFVDYRVNGKRIRRVVGTEEEAKAVLAELQSHQQQTPRLTPHSSTKTLKELFEEFLKDALARLAPNSYVRYQSIINNLIRFLNNKDILNQSLEHFDGALLDEYSQFRHNEGKSERTVNSELILLRKIAAFARENGWLAYNPLENYAVGSLKRDQHIDYLTKDEIKNILAHCDDWSYPVVYTILNTGLRKNELEDLTWDDVDLNKRQIHVHLKKDWAPAPARRTIPINEPLRKVLTGLLKQSDKSGFVFHDRKGRKLYPNCLRFELMKIAKASGVKKLTSHKLLRDTFAAHLVLGGIDLAVLSKLMGYSNLNTMAMYQQLKEMNEKKAVEGLEF